MYAFGVLKGHWRENAGRGGQCALASCLSSLFLDLTVAWFVLMAVNSVYTESWGFTLKYSVISPAFTQESCAGPLVLSGLIFSHRQNGEIGFIKVLYRSKV